MRKKSETPKVFTALKSAGAAYILNPRVLNKSVFSRPRLPFAESFVVSNE